MCLTIKLFWMKSALISFHNISILQGRLSASRMLKSFVSNTLVLWRGTLLGSLILICRASSLGSLIRAAHAAASSGAIGSPFHTG
jgi:hypothetical protein